MVTANYVDNDCRGNVTFGIRIDTGTAIGAGNRGTNTPFAAPLAGSWSKGDRVQNHDPAVGQPKAWICTVAGSPGTWTSEGNL